MKKIVVLKNTKKNRGLMYKSWNSKKMSTKYIILALIPTAIHQITAVLDVPNGILQRGKKAADIIAACTGNDWVTVAPGDIKQYNNDVANYNGATTTSQRDTFWRAVKKDLKKLMGSFQDAADDDVENSITIIESGGFRVKKVHIQQKQIFGVNNGVDSGTVDLVGPSKEGNHCSDWWYSPDGITYTRMRPTLESTTQMIGLTPGKWAWFMMELIVVKDGKGMEQPLKIMVK